MNIALATRLVAIKPGYWTELLNCRGMFLSDSGIVASVRRGRLRVLKGTRSGRYLAVDAPRRAYIHTLMCETFHGPRPQGAEARHLDGNRDNNDIRNLCWGTRRENAADRVRHGTSARGERNPMAKLTTERVAEMRQLRAATGLSYQQIGKQFGISPMTAYRAVEKQSWK